MTDRGAAFQSYTYSAFPQALYRRFLEISTEAKFPRERARAREALKEPARPWDRG